MEIFCFLCSLLLQSCVFEKARVSQADSKSHYLLYKRDKSQKSNMVIKADLYVGCQITHFLHIIMIYLPCCLDIGERP